MKGYGFKRIISKPTILTLVFLLVGSMAMATTGEKGEKPVKDPNKKSETTTTAEGPKDKKDSVGVVKNKVQASILRGYQTSYKPIESDSVQNSNEIVSFNFIKYMVQRFKFSEEIY